MANDETPQVWNNSSYESDITDIVREYAGKLSGRELITRPKLVVEIASELPKKLPDLDSNQHMVLAREVVTRLIQGGASILEETQHAPLKLVPTQRVVEPTPEAPELTSTDEEKSLSELDVDIKLNQNPELKRMERDFNMPRVVAAVQDDLENMNGMTRAEVLEEIEYNLGIEYAFADARERAAYAEEIFEKATEPFDIRYDTNGAAKVRMPKTKENTSAFIQAIQDDLDNFEGLTKTNALTEIAKQLDDTFHYDSFEYARQHAQTVLRHLSNANVIEFEGTVTNQKIKRVIAPEPELMSDEDIALQVRINRAINTEKANLIEAGHFNADQDRAARAAAIQNINTVGLDAWEQVNLGIEQQPKPQNPAPIGAQVKGLQREKTLLLVNQQVTGNGFLVNNAIFGTPADENIEKSKKFFEQLDQHYDFATQNNDTVLVSDKTNPNNGIELTRDTQDVNAKFLGAPKDFGAKEALTLAISIMEAESRFDGEFLVDLRGTLEQRALIQVAFEDLRDQYPENNFKFGDGVVDAALLARAKTDINQAAVLLAAAPEPVEKQPTPEELKLATLKEHMAQIVTPVMNADIPETLKSLHNVLNTVATKSAELSEQLIGTEHNDVEALKPILAEYQSLQRVLTMQQNVYTQDVLPILRQYSQDLNALGSDPENNQLMQENYSEGHLNYAQIEDQKWLIASEKVEERLRTRVTTLQDKINKAETADSELNQEPSQNEGADIIELKTTTNITAVHNALEKSIATQEAILKAHLQENYKARSVSAALPDINPNVKFELTQVSVDQAIENCMHDLSNKASEESQTPISSVEDDNVAHAALRLHFLNEFRTKGMTHTGGQLPENETDMTALADTKIQALEEGTGLSKEDILQSIQEVRERKMEAAKARSLTA